MLGAPCSPGAVRTRLEPGAGPRSRRAARLPPSGPGPGPRLPAAGNGPPLRAPRGLLRGAMLQPGRPSPPGRPCSVLCPAIRRGWGARRKQRGCGVQREATQAPEETNGPTQNLG